MQKKHLETKHFILVNLVLWSLATAEAGQQQQQQQAWEQQVSLQSSALPAVDVLFLKTYTHLAYDWKHNIIHAGAWNSSSSSSNIRGNGTTLAVHRRGTALANLQTVMERQVLSANFGVSGAVSITNPDPTASLVIDQLQLECQWGLSVVLPCSSTQQRLGTSPALGSSSSSSKVPGVQEPQALLIHPGDTAQCSVRWLAVPAKWGTNFRQSCRVVAKTASGGAAQSSHFLLDFASPHVLTVKQECVIARTQCEITGSTFYQTPGLGQQLEQGVLVCDNKTLTTKVIVNDVYGLEGGIPDDCSGSTKLSCTNDLTAVPSSSKGGAPVSLQQPLRGGGLSTSSTSSSSSSSSSGPAKLSSSSLILNVMSKDCEAAEPDLTPESGQLGEEADGDEADHEPAQPAEEDAPGPAPRRGSGRGRPATQWPPRHPRVSLHIDGTYVISDYTWLISSSVAPESLRVYPNSTAAAHYSVTALRVPVRPAVPPEYFIEGTITVDNQSSQQIEVASISAVLPWGQAALCKPPNDVAFPAKVDASSQLTCTFRLQYELGLKPGSLRAQVQLVGSPQPLKSWPKQFNFKRANMAYSAGACARVSMAFTTDATDLSVTHAGGDAPDFAALGTEVCDEFNKWYFTVLATPVGKVDGSAVVVSNAVVTPTTLPGADPSSTTSRSAVTTLGVEVVPWLLPESAPLLTAAGSWRRGGEVPIVSAVGGADKVLWGVRNESVTIRVNI